MHGDDRYAANPMITESGPKASCPAHVAASLRRHMARSTRRYDGFSLCALWFENRSSADRPALRDLLPLFLNADRGCRNFPAGAWVRFLATLQCVNTPDPVRECSQSRTTTQRRPACDKTRPRHAWCKTFSERPHTSQTAEQMRLSRINFGNQPAASCKRWCGRRQADPISDAWGNTGGEAHQSHRTVRGQSRPRLSPGPAQNGWSGGF